MAFGIKADFSKTGNEVSEQPQEQPQEQPKAQEQPKPDNTQQKPVEQQAVQKQTEQPRTEQPEPDKPTEQPQLSKEQVEAYFKSTYFKDKEFNGIDSLLEPQEAKEVVKEINPYQDVFDETDEAYFKFKKDTGLGRSEWDFVQKDISKISLIDLAVQKVRKETGINTLSEADTREYLEDKFSIDFSDDELSSKAKIELNAFVKPFKDELLAQKEQYLKPMDEAMRAKKNNTLDPNTLILPDGRKVSKEAYQKEIDQVKTEYLNNIKKGASSAAPSEFKIEIDDNGEKRNYNFKYEYSEQDKQSMLSDGSNIDAMLEKRYATENGFDHSRLVKGLWWGDEANQQKVIAAAMQQARAEVIAELSANDNNENYSRKPLERRKTSEDGYGSLTAGIAGGKKGFGVKVNL